VVRIIIEQQLDLDLEILLKETTLNLEPTLKSDGVVPDVFDYIMERLRAYYSEQGVAIDQFEAVLARRPTRPLDFHQRIEACKAFHEMPEAESLAAANKRIRNILRKAKDDIPESYQPSRLQEAAEIQLAESLDRMTQQVTPLFDKGDYNAALKHLAALREPVDNFFDQVMVMADDQDLRINRLALLQTMNNLFLRVADFSHWQS
jgi:glycyl-tRNA synthetase beta chain